MPRADESPSQNLEKKIRWAAVIRWLVAVITVCGFGILLWNWPSRLFPEFSKYDEIRAWLLGACAVAVATLWWITSQFFGDQAFRDYELRCVSDADTSLVKPINGVIRQLRMRARNSHFGSLVAIVAIFVVIGCGLWLYKNPGDDPSQYQISNITTRLGSVLLIIFLVQILVTMYQYASRLAAFYNARADALQLMPVEKVVELKELIVLLAPDKVGFLVVPPSPWGSLIQSAKEVGKAFKPE